MMLQQLYEVSESGIKLKVAGVGLFDQNAAVETNSNHHEKNHPEIKGAAIAR